MFFGKHGGGWSGQGKGMTYQVDLSLLLNRAFGIAAGAIKRYKVPAAGEVSADVQPYDIPTIEVLEDTETSVLGTPILLPVTFLAGRYPIGEEDGTVIYADYPEYKVSPATIVEITKPKRIVKTPINGKDFTVKEYNGKDDYRVRFRGFLINDDLLNPPEDEVRAFNRLTDIPAALEVQCDLFEWMGISDLVVENATVFELEGYGHLMAYTMDCISDSPTEVRLRDGL